MANNNECCKQNERIVHRLEEIAALILSTDSSFLAAVAGWNKFTNESSDDNDIRIGNIACLMHLITKQYF